MGENFKLKLRQQKKKFLAWRTNLQSLRVLTHLQTSVFIKLEDERQLGFLELLQSGGPRQKLCILRVLDQVIPSVVDHSPSISTQYWENLL